MSDTSNSLVIENLEFAYSHKKPVLNIESFSLKKTESVFLYGPSGSGKSTLLNICSGIMTPQKGSVRVIGEEINKLSASKRDLFRGLNIGVIFQQFNLIDYLNILDNVLLPARLHPKQNYRQTREKALKLLDQMGLYELKDQEVSQLSIGQRQRVAAVRSFLLSPPLLIADEPTSSLDAKNTKSFMTALMNLAKEEETSILFVSHDDRLKSYFEKHVSLEEINSVVGGKA